MEQQQADALRAPFKPSQIGRLPRGNITLDYVGHAATTDRLLQVDPAWTWAPVAHDERGLPRLDDHGGLWITLTVCGVTRLGYGDAGTKTGPNAVKEAIGDAIRNAAMRFGVALDLWAKEDLNPERAEHERAHAQQGTSDLKLPPEKRALISDAQRRKLFKMAGPDGYGLTGDQLRDVVETVTGSRSITELKKVDFEDVLKAVHQHATGEAA